MRTLAFFCRRRMPYICFMLVAMCLFNVYLLYRNGPRVRTSGWYNLKRFLAPTHLQQHIEKQVLHGKPRLILSDAIDITCFNGSDWLDCRTFCHTKQSFQKADLITKSGNISIYIHDPKDDVWVSAAIANDGGWESDIMHIVWDQLEAQKQAVFLDVGSHVGEYSLMSAKLGRETYAFDPLLDNIQRLCMSAKQNNFTKPFRIIYNAVSDKIQKVSLWKAPINLGGTRITDGEDIHTVRLDDLLSFVNSRTVVMKVDVEGMEFNILNGGREFFKRNRVVFVSMEWSFASKTTHSDIISFMQHHGLQPFDKTLNYTLDISNTSSWTSDIFWLPV